MSGSSSLPPSSTGSGSVVGISALLSSASASVDLLYDVSRLLRCGVDKSTVAVLAALCECGVQPEALATVLAELRREARAQPPQRANGAVGGSSGGSHS